MERNTSPEKACRRPNPSEIYSLATDSMPSVRFGRGCVPLHAGAADIGENNKRPETRSLVRAILFK
jgi:hypothetical protein